MRATVAMLLLAVAGCDRMPPPPRVTGVEPGLVRADADTTVAVLGEHFVPRLRASFDAPSASAVDAGFAIALISAGARVPLADVAWVDETRVTGRLPAGAALPGVHDLELTDPRGRRATLPAAVTVLVSSCSGWTDGTPCEDGDACTGGDTCQGGTCQPGAWICPGINTAPLACLTVTPTAGIAGATSFAFDASCSTDLQDPTSALQARFLFDYGPSFGGSWDTAFSTVKKAAHSYPSPGTFTAAVEVLDSGGLVGRAQWVLLVSAPGALVQVTTAADENDPGATPASPGGTGLSLREAIAYVNGQTAPQAISFAIPGPAPYRIVLGSALPALALAGAAIAGTPDVTVDCAGVGPACLTLAGTGQVLLGLSLTGNGTTALLLQGAGYQVADCVIVSTGHGAGVTGILAQAGGRVGPGNEVTGAGTGIQVAGPDPVTVDGNLVHGNATGMVLAGVTSGGVTTYVAVTVAGNLVFGNSQNGISASKATGWFWFNTVDGNGVHGLAAGPQITLDVQDNLFTNNGSAGVGVGASGLAPFDHNGYFGNGSAITGGVPGPTDVTGDPLYVNTAGADYRLLPGSPAVNAGVDVGVDVNGPGPGGWDGSGPDLGARESPY